MSASDAAGARPGTDHRQHAVDTARGGGFLAGGSVFEYATRFLVALLLARMLGADDYGLYVLALGAGSLFAGLGGLGLDDAMVRYVAIRSARGDARGVWGTIQVGLVLAVPVTAVLAVVCFAVADPIATGVFDEPRLAPLLRVTAVLFPFLTLSNMLNGISRGFERTDITALGENVVQTVVRLGLLALLALVGQLDVWAAVIVFGISDVAASLAMVLLLNRGTAPIRQVAGRDVARPVREVFSFALPLWLSGLLRQSRNRVETIILGVTVGVASVGIYAIVERVTIVGHLSLLAIFSAVKPVLARLHDQGDRDGLARLYRTATRWTLTLYLPFFVVVVLLAEPVLAIFGATFTAGVTAMWVLATAELVNAGTGICRSMIDMTGHTRVKVLNSFLYTAALVGSGVLLIPRFGLVGAATATLVATTLVNVLSIGQVWWLERLQPFDRTFLRPVAAATAAAGVGLLLRSWADLADRPLLAAVHALAIGVAYLGALLAIGVPEDDRHVVGRGAAWGRRLLVRQQRAVVALVSRGRSA